ncbi:MAG: hypothetical protein M3Q84_10540 [Actinomycetota bacterium]|jgi:hypothetical protein|nr:hypothetical protein [Actinomycetota bacterium]
MIASTHFLSEVDHQMQRAQTDLARAIELLDESAAMAARGRMQDLAELVDRVSAPPILCLP